jgi:hypothetical protein
METQVFPEVDPNVEKLLFHPLCLPSPRSSQPEQRPISWTTTRAGPAGNIQASMDWQTSLRLQSDRRASQAHPANSSNITQAQMLSHNGAYGQPHDPLVNRTVGSPLMNRWTGPPQLTKYSSPPAPSPVDPARIHGDGGALGATAQAARQPDGSMNASTQPMNIQERSRRSNSTSPSASDQSYSSGSTQALQFGGPGFHEQPTFGPQDAGSFVDDGQHMELATSNVGGQTTEYFEDMMNINTNILGAAMSINTRSPVDPPGPPPPSSASPNSSADDIAARQFSTALNRLDGNGSHFQMQFRGANRQGNTGYFEHQRNASLTRSMSDNGLYTQAHALF